MDESQELRDREANALYLWLTRWSRNYLRRRGLLEEESEDRAQEFSLTM